jgi:hypothetical protein
LHAKEAINTSVDGPAAVSNFVSLRFRFIAAVWFGGAATAAAWLLSKKALDAVPIDPKEFLVTAIVSAIISGFFLGGGLVDDQIVKTKAMAALIGMQITLICYAVGSVGPLLVMQTVEFAKIPKIESVGPFVLQIPGLFLLLFLGLGVVGWVIIPCGILAALVLHSGTKLIRRKVPESIEKTHRKKGRPRRLRVFGALRASTRPLAGEEEKEKPYSPRSHEGRGWSYVYKTSS